MAKNKARDPIPLSFASIAEAADFWDTHDLGEYGDQTREVEADVKLERDLDQMDEIIRATRRG